MRNELPERPQQEKTVADLSQNKNAMRKQPADGPIDKPKFAEAVERERKKKGLSQAELAEQLGCSVKTIQRWEDPNDFNVPQPANFAAVCTLLGIEAESVYKPPLAGEKAIEPSLPDQEQHQALASPLVPRSSINRQNRLRVLKQMQRIWIDGVLAHSLPHEASITLNLQDRPDVLENPWRRHVQETSQSPKSFPTETSIVHVYDSAEGELLILGEAGAGKTILLLSLTHTLLVRAERDEQFPIPIIFTLSSWAEKRPPLRMWLVEELQTKYQVPPKVGTAWIDSDHILPLLDGLDEVAEAARSTCVQQINTYYQSRLERGSSPLVICCRSDAYRTLSPRLMLPYAVSILPLTDEQINTYLKQAGEQGKATRKALDEDTQLRDLARQPLILTIVTLAYKRAQSANAPTGKIPEEKQFIIFAHYVEHMLQRRGELHQWEPDQVKRFLTFLAVHMKQHNQTIFSVENLQPSWLPPERRFFYQCCVGVVFGLVSGLPVILIGNSNVGLVLGVAIGFVVGNSMGKDTRAHPQLTIWVFVKRRYLRAWYAGKQQGECLRPFFERFFVPMSGPVCAGIGAVIGLINGVVSGLIGFIIRPDSELDAIDPADLPMWSWKEALSGFFRGLRDGWRNWRLWLCFVILGFIVEGCSFASTRRLSGSPGPLLSVIRDWLVGLLLSGPCSWFLNTWVGRLVFVPVVVTLFAWLLWWLLVGVLVGLTSGLSEEIQLLQPFFLSPNEGIWRSAKHGLLVGLAAGLLVGVCIAGIGGSLAGLAGGLIVGLLVALFVGLYASLQHFIVRFLLWQQGDICWNLVPLLDEAVGRLLLRKVGGSYSFAHPLLLEYFATLGRTYVSHRRKEL